jgi:hypothetical protein
MEQVHHLPDPASKTFLAPFETFQNVDPTLKLTRSNPQGLKRLPFKSGLSTGLVVLELMMLERLSGVVQPNLNIRVVLSQTFQHQLERSQITLFVLDASQACLVVTHHPFALLLCGLCLSLEGPCLTDEINLPGSIILQLLLEFVEVAIDFVQLRTESTDSLTLAFAKPRDFLNVASKDRQFFFERLTLNRQFEMSSLNPEELLIEVVGSFLFVVLSRLQCDNLLSHFSEV